MIDRPDGGPQIKTALRELVDKFDCTMICTPNQSLIIQDITEANKGPIEQLLLKHGILPIESIDPLTRYALLSQLAGLTLRGSMRFGL